jgi:hypothetical protein
MTKLIVAFRNFAKAPINVKDISVDWRIIFSVILKTCVGRRGPDCSGLGREQVESGRNCSSILTRLGSGHQKPA